MKTYTKDYYKILNVNSSASDEIIKSAYHTLSKHFHPDMGGDVEIMKELNEAYSVLSNPTLRANYDVWYKNTIEDFEITANVLDPEIGLFKKTFRKSQIKAQYDKYKDEDGEIYIIVQCQNSNKKNIVIDKKTWESHFALYLQTLSFSKSTDTPPTESERPNSFSVKRKTIYSLIVVAILLLWTYMGIVDYKEKKEHEREIAAIAAEEERISEAATKIVSKIGSIDIVTADDAGLIAACRILYDEAEAEVQEKVWNYVLLSEAEELISLIQQNPTPAHGTTSIKYTSTRKNPLAPLAIDLTQCADDKYYFIKILDCDTSEIIQTVFLHPKTKLEISLPIGDYEIRYCSGPVWYGPDVCFGDYNSMYEKIDDVFSFTKDSKGTYGYTITLYPVQDGNMETTAISPENF